MNFLRTSWLNVALPFLFLLMACSKPPDVPKLPGAPPTESDRLVFGERLSIQDIKAIFRTLNKHGQFDAFASLFTQPSDAELEPIAALISKYLYQQVDWETGLVRQMDKRIAKKGFSDWLHKTKKWATERSYPELGNLALHALGIRIFRTYSIEASPYFRRLSQKYGTAFCTRGVRMKIATRG